MERRFSPRHKFFVAGLALVAILILAGVAYVERTPLQAWYSVRGLASAGEQDQAAWVDRVAGLGEAAVPRLVGCLRRPEVQPCANAQAALTQMVQRWQPGDSRRADVAGRLAEGFADLSSPGQQAALEVQAVLVRTAERGKSAAALLPAATRLLAEASRRSDAEVHARGLALADELLRQTPPADALNACRELTRSCLRAEAAPNRLRAIQLAQRPGMDLQETVVPLLNDPVAEVRRAALLAVGASPNAIATDDLLPWLHDADEDVRRLCEQALRSRGLQEDHLKLGRLMTDRQPATRLQVLDLLRHAHDLEPGVWLRRLSHDPAPAVRAAAVRAAAEHAVANLGDRLEQMAQNDPSATVRQLAQYYLAARKPEAGQPSQP